MRDLKQIVTTRLCPCCKTKTLFFYPRYENEPYSVTCDYCDFDEEYTEENLRVAGVSTSDWGERITDILVAKDKYCIAGLVMVAAIESLSKITGFSSTRLKKDFVVAAKEKFNKMSHEEVDNMIKEIEE